MDLNDFYVGDPVVVKEGFRGVVTEVFDAPNSLMSYYVVLDGGMGEGQWNEAELSPVSSSKTASATQADLSIEGTAADDYPELSAILLERLPIKHSVPASDYHGGRVTSNLHEAGSSPSLETIPTGGYRVMDGKNHLGDIHREVVQQRGAVIHRRWRVQSPTGEVLSRGHADRQAAIEALLTHHKQAITLPMLTGPAMTNQEVAGQPPGYQDGYKDATGNAPTREPEDDDPQYRSDYQLGWADGISTVSPAPLDMGAEDPFKDVDSQGSGILDTEGEDFYTMEASVKEAGLAGAIWDFLQGDAVPSHSWEGIGNDWSYDWCRFRRNSHCWLAKDLDHERSKQVGYAVYIPVDRGTCWRVKWEDQKECPRGEPGPNVGGFTDATIPWEKGGQRGIPVGASLSKTADEDQCPYCAGDSLWSEGAYVCEEGHSWSPDEPAARAYHGDGTESGQLQPLAAEDKRKKKHRHPHYPWAFGVGGWGCCGHCGGSGSDPDGDGDCDTCGGTGDSDAGSDTGGGGATTASLTHTAAQDNELGFHVTAAWSDVRMKAKRIRTTGGVQVVANRNGTIVGTVRGDTNVYETTLNMIPGRHAISHWDCGCAWAAYSWGRSGPWKKFEGRMCSHALALQLEAQARGMFGREVELDKRQPSWLDPTIPVRVPGEFDKDKGRYSSLGTETWYHATPYDLTGKDRLLPPSQSGQEPNWEGMDESEAGLVFCVDSLDSARGWGNEIAGEGEFRVYEVTPEDEVSRSQDMIACHSAKIIRQVFYWDGEQAHFATRRDVSSLVPAVEIARSMLAEGKNYALIRAELTTLGVANSAAIVSAARQFGFWGRPGNAASEAVWLSMDETGAITDSSGTDYTSRDIFYPTWDSHAGLIPEPRIGALDDEFLMVPMQTEAEVLPGPRPPLPPGRFAIVSNCVDCHNEWTTWTDTDDIDDSTKCPKCGSTHVDIALGGINNGQGVYDFSQPLGKGAILEDEPEPAIPVTYGDEHEEDLDTLDDEMELTSHGAKEDPLAWLLRDDSKDRRVRENEQIAAAARHYLATGEHLAADTFTAAERQEIIEEGEGVEASNLDRLDITGTHYEQLEATMATQSVEDDETILWT